jgi:hypothetical protein
MTVPEPSILDIAVKLFYGADIYEKGMPFQIPYIYMVVTAFFGLSIGSYVVSDYKNMGVLHIIKYRKKTVWWYGKCIWNIGHTILMYLSVFLGIVAFCLMAGKLQMELSPGIVSQMGISMTDIDSLVVLGYIVLLGGGTVIALNQIQITLQMIFEPVTAYVVYLGNLVFSVLLFTPYLPGNEFMLARTKLFSTNGVGMGAGLGYVFLLWLIAVLVGRTYIKRSDVLF